MRPAPHSPHAEAACTAAVLLRGAPALSEVLDHAAPGDFYDIRHQLILTAAARLARAGQPIDTVTIERQITADEGRAQVSPEFLNQVSDHYGSARHAGRHAATVRQLAVQRQVIETCAEIAAEGHEAPEDLDTWLAAAERRIAKIGTTARGASSGPVQAGAILGECARLWAEGPPSAIPWGLADLDRAVTMGRTDLVVVGARPNVGKTALAVALAAGRGLPRRDRTPPGGPVLVFSLEMSRIQWITRTLAGEAEVNARLIGRADLPPAALRARDLAWERVAASHLFVDESTRALDSIVARTERFVRDWQGAHVLVVVDYLQKVAAARRESRVAEVGDIARGLKDLAKGTGATVLALAQVNRRASDRALGEPTMGDLRESGDIEAEADSILLLHRPELEIRADTPAAERARLRGVAWGLVRKNRHGPADLRVPLRFVPEFTRFKTGDPNQ